MLKIEIAKRRYNGETYIFILNVPSVKGEVGVLGIELKPYIICVTPKNCFGYNDTFYYNENNNNGYFSDRYHPNWIQEKIIDVCNKYYEKSLEKFYNNAYSEHGIFNKDLLNNHHNNDNIYYSLLQNHKNI